MVEGKINEGNEDVAEVSDVEEENMAEGESIEQQLDEERKKSQERYNQIKYIQADFDNYKKQFEKEKINIIRLANEELIKELIVILDDFENSMKFIENDKDKKGFELIYNKFLNILKKNGLKEIESVGNKFDHNKHEALLKEKSEKEEDEVIEEYMKGYMLNSKVIRHSKVKVGEKFKNDNEKIIMGEQK